MNDQKTIDSLIPHIQEWAIERKLLDVSSDKQLLKLQEELGELSAGYVRGDTYKVKDSLGDMFVVMTVFALQQGIDITNCVNMAVDTIKGRKGEMKNGVFVKQEDLQND